MVISYRSVPQWWWDGHSLLSFRVSCLHHQINLIAPPSTLIVLPVVYEACSEAKSAATATNFSVRP